MAHRNTYPLFGQFVANWWLKGPNKLHLFEEALTIVITAAAISSVAIERKHIHQLEPESACMYTRHLSYKMHHANMNSDKTHPKI